MNSDIRIGDKVRILKACVGPEGAYVETRELEGKILDAVTITEKNIVFIESLLRGGLAELFGDKRSDLANFDILPDSPPVGAGGNRKYFKTKRRG